MTPAVPGLDDRFLKNDDWSMTYAMSFYFVFLLATSSAFAEGRLEACATPERWAASMAHVHLKNANLLVNEEIDLTKTEVQLLASEKTKKNLYHQIQKVVFTKKNGDKISVITENDASKDECSMSGVKVFVISKMLGP